MVPPTPVDKYSTAVVYIPPVDKYSTDVVYTPPRNKFSTEVVYVPPLECLSPGGVYTTSVVYLCKGVGRGAPLKWNIYLGGGINIP